jgi:hypothetical protein
MIEYVWQQRGKGGDIWVLRRDHNMPYAYMQDNWPTNDTWSIWIHAGWSNTNAKGTKNPECGEWLDIKGLENAKKFAEQKLAELVAELALNLNEV